ncbi:MAG: TIGR03032 family protein [Chthoniobacteraceae bacterium]
MLRELRITLLVSTYQAGKLIVVRADGDALNTHFRDFYSPMGLAYDPGAGRLAIGTRHEVWHFFNQPAVAPKLPPKDRHDAAFLPRGCHITGDIRIHEIGWVGGELWAVNTRFSCLCTFDDLHSFVPRWRPPFVSQLAAEDRCHLNGMAIIDGRVKFVSCLGRSDTPGGWREHKTDGGCLLDVDSGEPVLTGMCMPHSPRRYAGRDWILESGIGSLSAADLATGKTEVVAKLPGFTRGMDFYRNIAFIGLSQVRETAIFSGIPVASEERSCGVWAVDIRTGRIIAFLRFEGIVQEIFAVEVLPDILYPDLINEAGEFLDGSFVLPDI